MRKGKDNENVSKRYNRPIEKTCPAGGRPLHRRYTLWHKYLVTLEGREQVFSVGYSGRRRRCSRVVYRSEEAEQLSPKGYSIGFDVITQMGWWRFGDQRTLDEIAALLETRPLPISRRPILYLIGDFLALLRAAQPAKIEAQRAYFKRHGMGISVDGMEPEQGNEMLFVVREAHLDLTLIAETLYSRRADLIRRQWLQPVKAFGFRIRAVIRDADKNIRRAVETSLPGCPHQACQVHCLCEVGAPMFEAERAMKTDLRRDLRVKLRPIRCELSQSPQDDPQTAVWMDYCEALRDALRADGVSPFKLAGLKLYDELQRLEQSLRRCQKKSNIVSDRPCWSSPSFAIITLNPILN